MVTAFRDALTPELVAAGRRARPVGPRAGDAGLAGREGDRESAKSGRSWPPSTPTGCGSAWACSAIPTVIYALERAGRYTGNLTRDDLRFDSPYNTYRYAGPAARTDRVARARLARSRGQSRPTCPTSTSSAATTARTCSRPRSTSTIATSSNTRRSRSSIETTVGTVRAARCVRVARCPQERCWLARVPDRTARGRAGRGRRRRPSTAPCATSRAARSRPRRSC